MLQNFSQPIIGGPFWLPKVGVLVSSIFLEIEVQACGKLKLIAVILTEQKEPRHQNKPTQSGRKRHLLYTIVKKI